MSCEKCNNPDYVNLNGVIYKRQADGRYINQDDPNDIKSLDELTGAGGTIADLADSECSDAPTQSESESTITIPINAVNITDNNGTTGADVDSYIAALNSDPNVTAVKSGEVIQYSGVSTDLDFGENKISKSALDGLTAPYVVFADRPITDGSFINHSVTLTKIVKPGDTTFGAANFRTEPDGSIGVIRDKGGVLAYRIDFTRSDNGAPIETNWRIDATYTLNGKTKSGDQWMVSTDGTIQFNVPDLGDVVRISKPDGTVIYDETSGVNNLNDGQTEALSGILVEFNSNSTPDWWFDLNSATYVAAEFTALVNDNASNFRFYAEDGVPVVTYDVVVTGGEPITAATTDQGDATVSTTQVETVMDKCERLTALEAAVYALEAKIAELEVPELNGNIWGAENNNDLNNFTDRKGRLSANSVQLLNAPEGFNQYSTYENSYDSFSYLVHQTAYNGPDGARAVRRYHEGTRTWSGWLFL